VLNLLRMYFNLKFLSECKMYAQIGGASHAQISIL